MRADVGSTLILPPRNVLMPSGIDVAVACDYYPLPLGILVV